MPVVAYPQREEKPQLHWQAALFPAEVLLPAALCEAVVAAEPVLEA